MPTYIGLDLGGTNLKAGLVDEAGNILRQTNVPSDAQGGPAAMVEVMAATSQTLLKEQGLTLADIQGIGLGAPGMIDHANGIVLAAPNLPGVRDTPIAGMLSDRFDGRPVALENDANAAAFGEYWAGAGRGREIQHMVLLTLGTGVGSGVIIEGKLLHGAFGIASEGGHMIVEPGGRLCGCGQHGCIEAYSSATNTALRARERVEADQRPSTLHAVLDQAGEITSRDVFEAAAQGDPIASEIVDETAYYLAIACITLTRLLDPQRIVLGGGMIAAGEQLFGPVREHFKQQRWHLIEDRVQIVPAQLGNDAGLIGAAAVACQKFGNR